MHSPSPPRAMAKVYIKSQYAGVRSQDSGKSWLATLPGAIVTGGFYVGSFASEEHAAKALDKCACRRTCAPAACALHR